jgi:hypothetical protein
MAVLRCRGSAEAWGNSSWRLGRAGAALDADLDGAELCIDTDKHRQRHPSGELLRNKEREMSLVREREWAGEIERKVGEAEKRQQPRLGRAATPPRARLDLSPSAEEEDEARLRLWCL